MSLVIYRWRRSFIKMNEYHSKLIKASKNDNYDLLLKNDNYDVLVPHAKAAECESMVRYIISCIYRNNLPRILEYYPDNKSKNILQAEFDARFIDNLNDNEKDDREIILEVKYVHNNNINTLNNKKNECNKKDTKFKSLFRVTSLLVLNFNYSNVTMTTDWKLKPRVDDTYMHNYIKYTDLVNMYQFLYNLYK